MHIIMNHSKLCIKFFSMVHIILFPINEFDNKILNEITFSFRKQVKTTAKTN